MPHEYTYDRADRLVNWVEGRTRFNGDDDFDDQDPASEPETQGRDHNFANEITVSSGLTATVSGRPARG